MISLIIGYKIDFINKKFIYEAKKSPHIVGIKVFKMEIIIVLLFF
jgi:hypothetical protein